MDRSLVVLVAFAAAALLSFSGDRALATDEPDELMTGRLGRALPAGRTVFVSKPDLVDFALPSAANDPTVEGATLRVFDTGGAAGDHIYVLPAANWRQLGGSVPKGFRYKRAVASEPCSRVKVSPRVVLAKCFRQGPDWALPFSGDMGVVLTIGTGSKRYCASFGGTTILNSPLHFRRVNAPAPSACASPSGAFLDEIPGGAFD